MQVVFDRRVGMSKRVRKLPKNAKLDWDTVYCGDSLEGMRLLDDESVD